MAIDLSTLQKLETLPSSLQKRGTDNDERMVVLVKMRKGADRPAYVEIRTNISQHMFAAELASKDLLKLEKDPAVESFSVSRAIPLIKQVR